MAMQFWEAKRKRRRRTTLFLVMFLILSAAVSLFFDRAVRFFATEGYSPPIPYIGYYLFGFIALVSAIYYLCYMGAGGSLVARSMGGIEIRPGEKYPSKVGVLMNVVEEMSIASRMPMPAVYVIEANEINAFAAGVQPRKAALAVTTGALESLTRDELQGVVAHEFGHIANEDMRIGMRLAALLMGFFFVFYIGLRLMEGSFFGRERNRGNSIAIIALLLLLAGAILWFAGSILRACVSREREYNADASAVEYTRNPNGIASALKKIAKKNEEVKDMPKSGLGYAHLYFDNRSFWSRLFATHPPIEKRIAILEDRKD